MDRGEVSSGRAQSVMQVANDNPVWNGRLNDIYDMLMNTVYILILVQRK